jgi:hypothetical protein
MGKGTEAHRKFGWMVRSSLDTSAAMVSATVHDDRLTALEYRKVAGANVEETRLESRAPDMIQLERKSNLFITSVARFGEPLVNAEVTDIGSNIEVLNVDNGHRAILYPAPL